MYMSGYRVKDPNGNYIDLSDIYSLKPFGITYTGTMTSISDASYNYYIMTTGGTLTISNGFGIQFSYLAVGGGGGGGMGVITSKIGGGGGGAGYVKTGSLKTIINDTINVSIGAGGTSNANGVNTTITFQSNTYNNLNIDCSGGLFGKNGGNGGSSTFSGGTSSGGNNAGGGGGGGYKGIGFNNSSSTGGNGGTGIPNPLNGAAIIITGSYIGCGGGGGGGSTSGSGGSGGGSGGTNSSGGSGSGVSSGGTDATPNTGGGGGGGGGNSSAAGGSGGSGLFVIAIKIS